MKESNLRIQKQILNVLIMGLLVVTSKGIQAQSMTVTNSLRLWLKADTAVTTNSSGLVQTWGDQSGNALNATQSVSTNRPTLKLNQINGKPAVRFDGTSDYLTTSSHTWTNKNFTVITVSKKWGNAKAYHHLISRAQDINTNGSKYFQILSSNGTHAATVYLNKSGARANTSMVLDTNRYHIITVTRQDKVSKGTKIYVDRVLSANSSSTATTNTIDGSANYSFFIGGWGPARAKSYISELLVYEKVLSTNDLAKVENYLQTKYNLTGGGGTSTNSVSAKASMGYLHTHYLDKNGALYFTGDDTSGNRGNGSGNSTCSSPVAVPGMTSLSYVASGSAHTLALKSDGSVYVWGDNSGKQVNASSSAQLDSPTKITALSGITDLSGGDLHSIARKSDGTAWSWGYNYYGALGNNTYIDSGNPVQVYNLTGVTDVEAGAYTSYAIKSNGTLWGWGDRSFGQLGDGTSNAGGVKAPKQVATGVSKVSSFGYHVLILKTDGTVWACGDNSMGQLGDGTTVQKNSFTKVPNLTGVTQIAAGWDTSFALKSDGTVWAWGNNTSGNLGIGSTTQKNSPTKISTLSSITSIDAGGFGASATASDGKVYTWGGNTKGQIGDGSTTMRKSPVVVSVP